VPAHYGSRLIGRKEKTVAGISIAISKELGLSAAEMTALEDAFQTKLVETLQARPRVSAAVEPKVEVQPVIVHVKAEAI
jgi:hypothetical protein